MQVGFGALPRVMLYLYEIVLGVTGAEGSSEEEVETLRSPPGPEELVVLLRVHVELPLGITPGILWEEEHALSGNRALTTGGTAS